MVEETDSSMKEVIDEFCLETIGLLDELDDILHSLENDLLNNSLYEEFGQKIDRIMGAAKSLGLGEIAQFCELGKTIGYKSGQTNNEVLLNVVVQILFDAVELLKKLVHQQKTGSSRSLNQLNTKAFASRLKWLSEKFKSIERASCEIGNAEDKEQLSQSSIDDLMKSLGL